MIKTVKRRVENEKENPTFVEPKGGLLPQIEDEDDGTFYNNFARRKRILPFSGETVTRSHALAGQSHVARL